MAGFSPRVATAAASTSPSTGMDTRRALSLIFLAAVWSGRERNSERMKRACVVWELRAKGYFGLSRQLPHSSLDSFAVRFPAGQGVVRTNGDPSAA